MRVPTADPPDTDRKVPDTLKLPWAQDGEARPVEYEPVASPCGTCGGDGCLQAVCPTCGQECPGDAECDECGGSGTVDYPGYLLLGGQWFAGRYIKQLSRLPNAMLVVPPGVTEETPRARLIRFDGGEALLMPCSPTKIPSEFKQ